MGRRLRGVRQRQWGSWVCEIRHPITKTRVWLGTYASAEAAARAYDAAAWVLCGPQAKTNLAPSPLTGISSRNILPPSLRAKLQRCCLESAKRSQHATRRIRRDAFEPGGEYSWRESASAQSARYAEGSRDVAGSRDTHRQAFVVDQGLNSVTPTPPAQQAPPTQAPHDQYLSMFTAGSPSTSPEAHHVTSVDHASITRVLDELMDLCGSLQQEFSCHLSLPSLLAAAFPASSSSSTAMPFDDREEEAGCCYYTAPVSLVDDCLFSFS